MIIDSYQLEAVIDFDLIRDNYASCHVAMGHPGNTDTDRVIKITTGPEVQLIPQLELSLHAT